MGIRGMKKGGKQKRWTDAEWAIIRENLANGNPRTRIKDLQPLLPDRSPHNIHNALNMERRRQKGLCLCGRGVAKPGHQCELCKTRARERRAQNLREGRCAQCGDPLGPGSSATLCPRCRAIHGAASKEAISKKPRKRSKHKGFRIIKWPTCSHGRWTANLIAEQGRPVFDIFAGSGETLRLVHEQDPAKHLPRLYNDIDPNIVALIRCVRDGLIRELRDALEVPTMDRRIDRAASLLQRVKPDIDRKHSWFANMNKVHKSGLYDDLAITNLDALELLDHPNTYFEPDAILIVDPPWVGCDHMFEHTLTPGQWRHLFDRLIELPDGMDFALSLGPDRAALEVIAKSMPAANLRWRIGKGFTKSALALSPRLARIAPDAHEPIDLRKLGLRQDL